MKRRARSRLRHLSTASIWSQSSGTRRLLLAALITGLVVFVPSSEVAAHPLGNFTVNRYSRLEIASDAVRLLYIVDMAEIPTFQEHEQIDRDADGSLSPAEQSVYLESRLRRIRENLHIQVGDEALALEAGDQRLDMLPGQGGLSTMRLEAWFSAALTPRQSTTDAVYRDDNFAGRLGWQEVVVRAAHGTSLLQSSVPADDLSDELRDYPEDLLQSPPAVHSAHFRFAPGSSPQRVEAVEHGVATSSRPAPDTFATLITAPILGVHTLMMALLLAFVLGASHALTPGHGKTIVAAYLVGSRGTARHALFLGLTTTITHTAGVFALGLITLFVSQFILPEQLYPWLGVTSGAIVVVIGFSLFNGRLRTLLGHHHSAHHHHHNEHSHDHGDGHHHHHDDPDHDHAHGPGHSHSHLPPGADGTALTWRSLLALGISGGIIPCPSALVVLLSAIALHRLGLGMLLIVAFSLGLASVLTGLGILLVYAGHIFERLPLNGRVLKILPVASALLVMVAGVGIVLRALMQTGLVGL
jgi:nickel/cobalt transporter (NicO) family protein